LISQTVSFISKEATLANRRASMARPKYVLLLPLNYNDGSEVPKQVRDEFLDELFILAGGYHIAGSGTGAYRMQDGPKQVDHSLQVWVAVEEEDVPALKRIVATYAGILKQESLYLERAGGLVEFIAPLSVGGTAQ
jgi:hypothetical protein